MRWSLVGVVLVAVITGCGAQPLPVTSPPIASPTPVIQPSAAASQLPSAAPSTGQQPPSPSRPDVGHLGFLASYCDLGTCCPAVDVEGTLYALRLPPRYEWRWTAHELRDRDGAVTAAEGDTVFVQGDVSGPDTCWAASLQRSIDVEEVALAYVGGLLRVDVCLVLSTEHGLLEMTFPEGWDHDLVDGRMVVRDAKGAAVMGEGDRVAVIGKPEREATGSFCMVGDDIIRVARVVAAWD